MTKQELKDIIIDVIKSNESESITGDLLQEKLLQIVDFDVEVNSKNIWREHKLYSYKVDRNNIVTEEILKINDDLMDSIRYAMMTHPIDRPKVKNIFF